jgi:hypothetical protein
MSPDKLKIISTTIKKKGNEIQSILPILQPGVPRQAQAHLYKAIKDSFGVPVKEIPNDRFEEVMRVIHLCCEYAEDPHVEANHLGWVVPEQVVPPATLDDFFS